MITPMLRGGDVPVTGEHSPAGFRSPEFWCSRRLHGGVAAPSLDVGIASSRLPLSTGGDGVRWGRFAALRDHSMRSRMTRRRSMTAAFAFFTGRTVRVFSPATSAKRSTSRVTKRWKCPSRGSEQGWSG